MSQNTEVENATLFREVPLIETVARTFASIIRESLTTAEMELVNSRNAIEQDKKVCHSHDFCDPNMLMLDAFRICGMTEEPDQFSEADLIVWNQAWEVAIENKFWVGAKFLGELPIETVRDDVIAVLQKYGWIVTQRGTIQRTYGSAFGAKVATVRLVEHDGPDFHSCLNAMFMSEQRNILSTTFIAFRNMDTQSDIVGLVVAFAEKVNAIVNDSYGEKVSRSGSLYLDLLKEGRAKVEPFNEAYAKFFMRRPPIDLSKIQDGLNRFIAEGSPEFASPVLVSRELVAEYLDDANHSSCHCDSSGTCK